MIDLKWTSGAFYYACYKISVTMIVKSSSVVLHNSTDNQVKIIYKWTKYCIRSFYSLSSIIASIQMQVNLRDLFFWGGGGFTKVSQQISSS